MSPIFPKRAARNADISDPTDFNEDLLPAAEKIGSLDQHDFTGSDLKANLTVAGDAYYNPYWTFTEVDPGFGVPAAYTYPSTTLPADAVRITAVSDWNTLESRTLSTGVSTLWIQAWAQYNLHEWTGVAASDGHLHGGNIEDGIDATNVEFALRVDGRIVETTIGSEYDRNAKHVMAFRADNQYAYGTGTRLPGPGLPEAQSGPGCGPESACARVSAAVSVNPGSHTVELVARRVNPPDRDYISGEFVSIYNRNIFVLDCPIYPASAPTRSSLEIDDFEDGTTISSTEMYTNRYQALATRYNAIQEGDIARGALNNRHLPGALLDKVQVLIEPSGSLTADNVYPGFTATTTFTTSHNTGAQGWRILDEVIGGKKLQTDSGVHTGFSVAGVNCYLVIQADIQLTNLFVNRTFGLDEFAFLALYYKPAGGVDTILRPTICFWNRTNEWDGADITDPPPTPYVNLDTDEHHAVSLFYVLDYSKGGAADIDYIGVAACGLDMNFGVTPGPAQYSWRRASLSVLQLRA